MLTAILVIVFLVLKVSASYGSRAVCHSRPDAAWFHNISVDSAGNLGHGGVSQSTD